MKMRVVFALLAFLTASLVCSAQKQDGYREEESSDFRARASVTLGYKPTSNLDLTISEELRFRDNLASFDRSYTTVEAKYSPVKRLDIIGGYTLAVVSKQTKTIRHRAELGTAYTFHAGNFRIGIRELVQCSFRTDSVNVAEKANPALVLRSRLRVSYKFPYIPIVPYIGAELYNTLNSPEVDMSQLKTINGSKPESLRNYICRYRATAGLKYRINAHTSIEAYYLYDRDINYDVNVGRKSHAVNRVAREVENRHTAGLALCHYF